MEKETGQIFRELKEDITSYAELKFDIFRLSAYEAIARVAGLLSYGLILMFLAFFALLFIFFSVGFLLGDLFNSIGLGFACVSGLYLLIMLIVVLNKTRVKAKVINEVVEALMNNDDKENGTGRKEHDDTAGEAQS